MHKILTWFWLFLEAVTDSMSVIAERTDAFTASVLSASAC
jgi:hypothetical protein